jgi:hypothetical protein
MRWIVWRAEPGGLGLGYYRWKLDVILGGQEARCSVPGAGTTTSRSEIQSGVRHSAGPPVHELRQSAPPNPRLRALIVNPRAVVDAQPRPLDEDAELRRPVQLLLEPEAAGRLAVGELRGGPTSQRW